VHPPVVRPGADSADEPSAKIINLRQLKEGVTMKTRSRIHTGKRPESDEALDVTDLIVFRKMKSGLKWPEIAKKGSAPQRSGPPPPALARCK